MKTRSLIITLSMLALILASCGSSRMVKGDAASEDEREYSKYADEKIAGAAGAADYDAPQDKAKKPAAKRVLGREAAPSPTRDQTPQTEQPKENDTELDESVIIYEADCTVAVKRVKDAVQSIGELAKARGGYIDNSASSDSYRSAYMTVRIPSKGFDPFLKDLERVGRIDRKDVKATNVSDEYRDLSLRLETSQKVLERLNGLLKKETDISQRIAILREIDRVSAKIASIQARMTYLKGLSDYATVRITLTAERQDAVRHYLPSPFTWIRALNPEARTIKNRSPLVFAQPEGYFALTDEFNSRNGVYLFTLPGDKVGIRIGAAELYPKADQRFWKDAFTYDTQARLYQLIESKEIAASGLAFALYHFRVTGGKYYSVAFATTEKEIIVVEALYADEESFRSQKGAIEKMVASGGEK